MEWGLVSHAGAEDTEKLFGSGLPGLASLRELEAVSRDGATFAKGLASLPDYG